MNIKSDKEKSALVRAFVWIFAISLVLRVWFNFFDVHANAAYACDAAEYLRDAQGISVSLTKLFGQSQALSAGMHVLFGYGSPDEISLIKEVFIPLQEMAISGPVFPVFLLGCYKIFGQDPSFSGWMIPIAVQCLLSALTAVLIASIGNSCWGKGSGVIAGILAAIYPGFIINSGRLYSESFATFLTCIVLWLVVGYLISGRTHYKWGFLLGICLFALQTTRSIMILLSIAILGFFTISSFLTTQKKLPVVKYLLAMIAAFVICLLPWLAVQKLAFGKTSLIVDRVGNYNLFMGNDVDTLGWLSVPYPDSTGMEKESHWQLFKQAIHRSPERWLKLMLDKPVRLLKLPWNDFKTSIGQIDPAAQAIFHQLILVFAAIGSIFLYSYLDLKYKRPKILATSLILFTFLLHLAYLAFITVPRYNLTAMPEVILFAGAGLALTMKAISSRRSTLNAIRLLLAIILLMVVAQLDIISAFAVRFSTTAVTLTKLALMVSIFYKALALSVFFFNCWQLTRAGTYLRSRNCALIAIFLLAFFTLPAYCLPLRAHGRWYEWSQDLQHRGEYEIRLINLDKQKASKLKQTGAYLAINLSGGAHLATDWDLELNDVKLVGPFIPAMSMAQDLSLVHLNKGLSYTIEQESILGILCAHSGMSPLDLRQWYLIPISANQGAKILNNADQIPFDTRSIRLAITIKKRVNGPGTIYGAYAHDRHFSLMPSIFNFSWEKAFYGVENERGLSDPAYDQKILVRQASDNDYIKLLLPCAPAWDRVHVSEGLNLAQKECGQARFVDGNLVFSFKPKDVFNSRSRQNDYWLVRLFGELERSDTHKATIEVGMNFSTILDKNKSSKEVPYVSPWVPDYVQSSSEASPGKFDICFPIMINAFPAHLNEIELHFTQIPNKEISSMSKNDPAKCCLEVYKMKRLPSGVQYEIF